LALGSPTKLTGNASTNFLRERTRLTIAILEKTEQNRRNVSLPNSNLKIIVSAMKQKLAFAALVAIGLFMLNCGGGRRPLFVCNL
jgi:hypothetical protein